MKDWLIRELAPSRHAIAGAYLFGSVLNATLKPRDVDLALVAIDSAGAPAWQQLRTVRDTITPPFLMKFGVPLSILVLTLSEWGEVDDVIVRERELLW
jgi:predicted nucleotidyltransferase